MGRDVVQAERLRIPDQLAEHAVPARQRADSSALLLVDADEQEARQLLLPLVQDPDGGVAGAREVAGGPQDRGGGRRGAVLPPIRSTRPSSGVDEEPVEESQQDLADLAAGALLVVGVGDHHGSLVERADEDMGERP